VKKFKYLSSHRDKETIWACTVCKKTLIEEIISRKWRLIDIVDDAQPCGVCELEQKVVTKSLSVNKLSGERAGF